MKKKFGFLHMATGSLFTIIFLNYIEPIIGLHMNKLTNEQTLSTAKVQLELNELAKEDIPNETSLIGFNVEEDEEYYEEDDDYED